MLKCPSCTQEVSPQSEECPSCGASLEESYAPTRLLGEPAAPASSGRDSGRSRAATLGTLHTTAALDSIDDARFVSGTVLAGRYRIVGLLGRGGMGEVYRADDLTLKQSVALKFLPERVSNDPASLARVYQEVSLARQVSHRNVCRVYDIGEADGQHFLSMEFVRGEELASVLKRFGRLPNDKAVDIARQLCAGLHAVHERGVLHRDLKPANVMIDENGNVRLTDFGLAALGEELGGDGVRAGTPAYMSPEQLAGRDVSVRSDIYSLGLVLYEIFTGRRAFEAATLPKMLELRKSLTAPTSPSDGVKDLDPLVERVVERCLEQDAEKRPATALQVAAALPGGDPLQAALAAGETPSPEMVAAAPKEGVLRPAVAVACLAALVVGLALVVLLSSRVSMHRRVALEKSPEALKERARDLATKFGYTEPPTDTAYGFAYHQNYLQHVRDKDRSPSRWERFTSS
ncbi:MAG TPA: serine/threonine-protein kinase, partial [Pyrinomonadaceae bacterium]|nr:serine/threonine-protein kinase [Pyrinomonadaceae bacterium]